MDTLYSTSTDTGFTCLKRTANNFILFLAGNELLQRNKEDQRSALVLLGVTAVGPEDCQNTNSSFSVVKLYICEITGHINMYDVHKVSFGYDTGFKVTQKVRTCVCSFSVLSMELNGLA